MALANVTYTGDGTTTDFAITFDYLDSTHIAVFVDGVATTDVSSAYQFELLDDVTIRVTAIAGGAVPSPLPVKVSRITPVSSTTTVFADGAVVRASALNNNTTQMLYIAQEVQDNDASRLGLDTDNKYDAQGYVIKNVGTPTNADDVASKGYLENTWLTLSDKAQLNSLNLTNLNTVATDVANVNTTATNIADVNTVATNIADVNTLAGISANVTSAVNNAANINAVVADAVDIGVVASNITDVNTVAGIDADVTTVAGISSDVTAVAADATDIGTVSTNIANVNTVAGISADVSTVAADGTDIGVVAGISSDVTTVSGISANVTSVAGNTANINAVAADATDIGTVATNIANVNTAAGISANITAVANIAADVTAAATNASDISAIAAEVAKVVTVANDLNEATSEIDVVANNIANVNLVGADIAAVINASNNLADINAFGDTYFIDATAPSSPTLGDLWFDTSSDTMKVYGASGWQNAGSSVNGTSQRVTYTATSGQTSFAATYDAGFVDVYLNGIKLIDGTDFTATSGTSVVLASGAALNDTVDIVAYGTFTLLSTVLDDLSDVNTAGATSGQVLSYNGASWSASTPSVPTLSSLGIANHDDITVDGSGNVGIGTSSLSGTNVLHLLGANSTGLLVESTSTISRIALKDSGTTDANAVRLGSAGDAMSFIAGSAERMRIDSSGNLLVGTTTNGTTADGTVIRASAETLMTRSNGAPLLLNRRGTDGAVIEVRNDNSTVGYITANAGGMGVYLGGTGSANHLDDYEEGTISGTLLANSGSFTTATYTGRYRKIGSLVNLSFQAQITSLGSAALGFVIPLPFQADGVYGYSGSGRRMSDSVQFHIVLSGVNYLVARNTCTGGTLNDIATYYGSFAYQAV